MDEANTRPWERNYRIKQTLVLAELPELRVIDLTLAPGERVPWHLHPDNDDLFICLRQLRDPADQSRASHGHAAARPAQRAQA